MVPGPGRTGDRRWPRSADGSPVRVGMDPVEPHIHSFIVKVWQEVVVGDGDEQGWRGYVTHVPSGARRYFEDLAEILAFVPSRRSSSRRSAAAIARRSHRCRSIDDVTGRERTASGGTRCQKRARWTVPRAACRALQDQLKQGDADVNKRRARHAATQARAQAAGATRRPRCSRTLDEARPAPARSTRRSHAAVGPAATAAQDLQGLARPRLDRGAHPRADEGRPEGRQGRVRQAGQRSRRTQQDARPGTPQGPRRHWTTATAAQQPQQPPGWRSPGRAQGPGGSDPGAQRAVTALSNGRKGRARREAAGRGVSG